MSYEERKSPNRDEELLFQELLNYMDRTISDLLPLLSKPKEKEIGSNKVIRFPKKDPRHAIVLKFVLLTSNLRAGKLLIDHGFVYEWSVMRRVLDDALEAIILLLTDRKNMLRQTYLQRFYTEDLDEQEGIQTRRVPSVGRGRIRESVISGFGSEGHEQRANQTASLDEIMKWRFRVGSGYIHGRMPQIMSLYDSEINRFRTDGVDNKKRLTSELKSFWAIASQAITCFNMVRMWVGDYSSYDKELAERFRKVTGSGD